MGRAIVRKPQAFLMDEPLSNLDAKLRVQMRADIAKLQRDLETTTIYVTHDQVEAMTMGDRVAVMNHGVLQQVDTPQRLYDMPANLFVAGFIGTPPMNLLEASVVAQNGSVSLALADQRLALTNEALARFPSLRGHDRGSIILGVRSDDLHLAQTRPDLPVLTAKLELIEALGSQSMAYFRVGARAIRTDLEDVEDAVEESEGEGVTATRPNFVAAFPARTALGLRIEDDVPLGVDLAEVHLFDSDSGAPLR
jgi:multiple sugar transport system ATP-binding protein